MKKLFTFFAIVLLAGSVRAQSLWNPGFASGHLFRAQFCANWASGGTAVFYPGGFYPISGYIGAQNTKATVANQNVTPINVAGTLRNWIIIGDTVDAAERDSVILEYSLDTGKTWMASNLMVILGTGTAQSQPEGADNTNSLAVIPGELLTVAFTANSINQHLSSGASCIEFDAKQ